MPALFDIDIDPSYQTAKPYADISKQSYFKTEPQILFMIGSIFKIESIFKQNVSNILTIKLTLCSNNNHDDAETSTHDIWLETYVPVSDTTS